MLKFIFMFYITFSDTFQTPIVVKHLEDLFDRDVEQYATLATVEHLQSFMEKKLKTRKVPIEVRTKNSSFQFIFTTFLF